MALAEPAEATVIDAPPRPATRGGEESLRERLVNFLPRGNLLSDEVWRKRHNILQWLLLLHLPALVLFGFYMKHPPLTVLYTVAPIAVFRILGGLPTGRRLASFFTTAGIVYCSAALVALANGAIEAHFHFFIIVGFIALYQDWVPFGWNIVFTVLSHGIGSTFQPTMMFNHASAMQHPWTWSVIHGVSVLAACVGVVLFWRTNEDEQRKALALTEELGTAEVNRRKFTSELLVNLARRNQSLLYRQLDIINQLEHAERDPDALAGLFRLDHLATRIRRNAENLLVLSGAEPPRVWGKPVPLTDVVRAAIAETEDLSRVGFVVDERLAVLGNAVIDLTHLMAELIENAVRSSPPESQVTIRTTPDIRAPGTVMLTVEDWGVGMPAETLAEANGLLAEPRDIDALVSNRLGLHVVARLAKRYGIQVVLTATSGSGITAVVLLPPDLFTASDRPRSNTGPVQFATPVASNSAPSSTGSVPAALEGSLLPQRSARPGGTLNDLIRTPSNGSNGSNGSRTPLAEGPPSRPTNGTRAPAANGSSSQPLNGAVHDPVNGRSSRPSTPPPPAPTFPALTPSTPPLGVRVPRTGPNWDGWWDPETGPTEDGPQAGWPEPQGRPQPQGRQVPDWQDDPENGADRREPVSKPIVHGVTLTVSEAHSSPVTPAATPLRLSRRVPQAHLAPELQRDRQAADRQQAANRPAAQPQDAARAREALSRYQASRRAALVENESTERNGS